MIDADSSFIHLAEKAGKNDDNACIVKFFYKPVLLGKKSRDEGRKIYEDREYINIQVKGQDKQVVVREVREEDINRFPQAYLAFKNKNEAPTTGTPLEYMGGVSPSLIEQMRPLGIKTVEDVAGLTDEGLIRIGMGARELQRQCRAYLDKSTGEVAELREQLEAEKKEKDDLMKRIEALEAKSSKTNRDGSARKKPGPKPKSNPR